MCRRISSRRSSPPAPRRPEAPASRIDRALPILPGFSAPPGARGLAILGLAAIHVALGLGCGGAPGARGTGGSSSKEILRGRVIAPAGRTFGVEVVQDDLSRQRGLQHRSRLEANGGMLFVFPRPGRHRFWMYECLIPLDIAWLDGQGRVLHVEEALPVCGALPCPDYGPDLDSVYVLEIGAGLAAPSGIRSGARLEILFAQPPSPR